jgi:16S rRNA (guanine966-N2)-methyltransferase
MKHGLRITGGVLKGRRLNVSFTGNLRPATEKLRQGFFERVIRSMTGHTFVDAFAGSGIMGLEALSRGAGHAVFLESIPELCEMLRKNLNLFEFETRATVICGDVRKTIKQALQSVSHATLFFDPPYQNHVMPSIFSSLSDPDLSRAIHVAVVEHHHKHDPLLHAPAWTPALKVRYGETALTFAVPIRNSNTEAVK